MSDLTSSPRTRPARSAGDLSIVGLGAVTGYGWGVEPMREGMARSQSAVRLDEEFSEAMGFPAYVARVVDDPSRALGATRYQRAFAAAVDEAAADAQRRGWRPGPSVAVINAAVLGDVEAHRDFYHAESLWRPRRYLEVMPSTTVFNVMSDHGWHGPMLNLGAMCASGNSALLVAAGLLATGTASDVVIVASDLSMVPEHVRQFAAMGVLKCKKPVFEVCRPYHADSQGYAAGEAVAALVCSLRPTGAYVRMLGGATTADGYHPTSIDPSLVQLRRCWEDAFDNAGLDPWAIRYLNGHGPGTLQSDGSEADLMGKYLSPAAEAYSFKPLLGHCQAAAAGIEILAMCLAYDTGMLLAPPAHGPTYIPTVSGPTPMERGLTAKSSIGLGGHNTMTVFAPAD